MRMPQLALRHHLQRLQPALDAPLPADGVPSPIDRDPALGRVEAELLEQLDVDVDGVRVAAVALVDDLDVRHRDAGGRVVDGDGGAAEGVVVGVGGGEARFGDGDDGFALRGRHVAGGRGGAHGWGVEGQVAGVGGGEGDGDGEGEDGEGEGAGFHFVGGWGCDFLRNVWFGVLLVCLSRYLVASMVLTVWSSVLRSWVLFI